MALLEIITYGHPILEKRAEDVSDITDELKQLAKDMIYTMYAYNGVGLAAVQVGVSKRIVVVDVNQKDTKSEAQVFINPEIFEYSEEKEPFKEGCLSFPEIEVEIIRPKSIKMRWKDLDGKSCEQNIDGLLARVLQHEVDHIDGVVFVKRMGRIKKTVLAPKLNKLKKETVKKFGLKKRKGK